MILEYGHLQLQERNTVIAESVEDCVLRIIQNEERVTVENIREKNGWKN
jgi:hypothetical protein